MPMGARNSKPLYPADTRQRIKHASIKKKKKKGIIISRDRDCNAIFLFLNGIKISSEKSFRTIEYRHFFASKDRFYLFARVDPRAINELEVGYERMD